MLANREHETDSISLSVRLSGSGLSVFLHFMSFQ